MPPPTNCHVPPNTPYAKLFDVAMHQSRVVGEVAKEQVIRLGNKAKKRVDLARASICVEVPVDCDLNGEVYQRSMREKILCGHIPECNDDLLPPRNKDFELTKGAIGDWSWT